MFSLKYLIEPYQFFWPNQPKKRLIDIFQNANILTFGSGYFLLAQRYQLDFFQIFTLCQHAVQPQIFLKSDNANQPDQPNSRKFFKMDNFCKNWPIWLKFGMQVSFTLPYHPEKFRRCIFVILPSTPTNPKADLQKKFQTSETSLFLIIDQ